MRREEVAELAWFDGAVRGYNRADWDHEPEF